MGIAITVYAAKFLAENETKYEWVRTLNEKGFSFTLLGTHLKAIDIFTLECLGFIIGLASWFLYRAYVPAVIDPGKLSARDSLARSMRRSSAEIPGTHLLFTLRAMRETASQKAEWKNFDWEHVDGNIDMLDRQLMDREALGDNAAKVIEVFPPDDSLLLSFGEDLFNITRPILRVLLLATLSVAFVLTSLPVLVRVMLLFFPILEKEPSRWWT